MPYDQERYGEKTSDEGYEYDDDDDDGDDDRENDNEDDDDDDRNTIMGQDGWLEILFRSKSRRFMKIELGVSDQRTDGQTRRLIEMCGHI